MENADKTNAVSNSELIKALSPTPCDITDDIQAWAVVYDDGEVGVRPMRTYRPSQQQRTYDLFSTQ